MQGIRLSRRFISLALSIFVGGCALGNNTFAGQQTTNVATFSSPLSYQVYNILAAEMFIQEGNPGQAALHYAAAAQQSDDPAIARRAVELAVGVNDNALAARALERWVALEPESPEALQYQAINSLRAGKYEAAAKALAKVHDKVEKEDGHGFEFIVSLLALEPDAKKSFQTLKQYVQTVDSSARAQLALATLAINSDQFEDGLKAARTAKQAGDKPQQEQASRLIAKALAGMDRVPDAVTELETASKASKNPDLKLDYARMLILADRRAEATPIFKQLYASHPDNTDILYTLGLLYLEQKEFAFAEPLIKKLLDIPERATEASYFMGQIQEGQKRPEKAIRFYQQAMGGHYEKEATLRVASLLLETESLESARQWLEEQQQATSNDDRKLLLLQTEGHLLHDKGRYKDAIASYGKALELKPDDFDTLYSRALSAEKAGDFKAAEADLRTLLQQEPDNATVLNALGYMLVVNTERYPDAEALINKALQQRPNDPAIMDSMGWILFRTGKLAEAESWLRKAYTQLQDPEIASHLIEVLSAGGKQAEAKTLLDEMLVKYPDDAQLVNVRKKLVGL
ncbi:MAG: tetratricopeptide repeat protein [Thiothrix sp.]